MLDSYLTWMWVWLEAHADGKPHESPEIWDTIVTKFGLEVEDQIIMGPDGQNVLLVNHCSWCAKECHMAQLVAKPEQLPQQMWYQITPRGFEVLSSHTRDEDLHAICRSFDEYHWSKRDRQYQYDLRRVAYLKAEVPRHSHGKQRASLARQLRTAKVRVEQYEG
jgi:hypothetical protein